MVDLSIVFGMFTRGETMPEIWAVAGGFRRHGGTPVMVQVLGDDWGSHD